MQVQYERRGLHAAARTDEALLEFRDVSVDIHSKRDVLTILAGNSFIIRRGERVGIVGESGCGKSMTAMAAMGLLPRNARVRGKVIFQGRELNRLSRRELERVRGEELGIVFQEPMSSLNPVLRIQDQLTEGMRRYGGMSSRAARAHSIELLNDVGLVEGSQILNSYPHELSGGMLQRVMIAIAISCNPQLLIADEATTALDVTTQAQILDLLSNLQESSESSLIFISHDLGVIAEICERIIVMYAGKIIEDGPASEVLAAPRHPYTAGLLESNPALIASEEWLKTIPGRVPDFGSMPVGCRFRPRCEFASEQCTQEPILDVSESGRQVVACWHPMDSGVGK